jgi:hypothetical protein
MLPSSTVQLHPAVSERLQQDFYEVHLQKWDQAKDDAKLVKAMWRNPKRSRTPDPCFIEKPIRHINNSCTGLIITPDVK